MALEVETSPFDVSLNVESKCHGRWTFMDLDLDYPELVGRGYRPLGVEPERGPLRRGADDEEPATVEDPGPGAPGLPERTQNPSALPPMPPSRSPESHTTAAYVERQLLIDGPAREGNVPFHLSGGDLHLEERERDPAEGSTSAEGLDSLLDLPRVLPARGADATFCSPLDVERRGGLLLLPSHSSTPTRWSSTRNGHLGATMLGSPRTSISFQRLGDGDLKQQGMARSKSFPTAAARSLSETPAPLNLPSRWNLKGSCVADVARPSPLDRALLAGQMRKMSPFQADYWVCAIPDGLPPSPDRQSPHWDPNKEYEDLLDYTYPLRPKHKLAPNPDDSLAPDSGVDLDSLSLSPESSWRFLTRPGQDQEATGIRKAQGSSLPSPERGECSAPVSRHRPSPVGKVSFAGGEPSAGKIGSAGWLPRGLSPRDPRPGPSGTLSLGGRRWNSRGHDYLPERDASGSKFMRSTRVLPLQVDCSGDEEYLSLPPRLKELETLAQQLTDLSLTTAQPEPPQRGQDDLPLLCGKGEQPPAEVPREGGSDGSRWESFCDSWPAARFHKDTVEDIWNEKGCKDHDCRLREKASCDLESPEREIHHISKEKGSRRDSLAQHIKIFCGQLEELIPWLHRVAEVTDNWIPPRPDIESVKTSLHDYLEFRKDLAGHRALTEGVLREGERLIECMASDSPVLQKTLGLIAKQSSELENHAERLYESIVAAMDAVGAGFQKNRDAQQIAASAESSKWVKSESSGIDAGT